MRMSETPAPDALPIDAYGDDGFRVAGAVISGAMQITPAGASAWRPRHLADIRADDFAALIAAKDQYDVLLIGVGGAMARPDAECLRALDAAGVAYDFMTTASACRTYNVMLIERRRVAAALIIHGACASAGIPSV